MNWTWPSAKQDVGAARVLAGDVGDLGVVHVVVAATLQPVRQAFHGYCCRARWDDRVDQRHRLGSPSPSTSRG